MAVADSSQFLVQSVSPPAAIPGGCLEVRWTGFPLEGTRQPAVTFGDAQGRLVFSSPGRLLVVVPDDSTGDQLTVHAGGMDSPAIPFSLGTLMARGVHPVANPVVDVDGSILTTLSGQRGKKTPVSVYRISSAGDSAKPFVTGIMNPSGLLLNRDGSLLVSSRHDGTVYEATPDGELRVFAEGMGVATGLAMDVEGNVFVGDRSGTIFKISPERKIFVFATLEPSVAAYHLAASPDGGLFVTAPTTSSFDSIYRVGEDGTVVVWRRGFGRPQGMAFDGSGRLHLCASHQGRRGVFRLTGKDGIEQVVSGHGIVGLTFDGSGRMVVATGSSVYRFQGPLWALDEGPDQWIA